MIQPRENGGRFGRKAPAPAPAMTAQEELAMRRRQAHLLLSQAPAQINAIVPWRHGEFIEHTAQERRSQMVLSELFDWLKQIAETGYLPAMERAWHAWRPIRPVVKNAHRSRYDALCEACGRRWRELWERVEAEEQPHRVRREFTSAIAGCREKAQTAREAWEKAEAEVAHWEAKKAAWEAQLAGEAGEAVAA